MAKYQPPRMARIEKQHPGLSLLITRINQIAHKVHVVLLGEQNEHVVVDATMAESVEPLSSLYCIQTLNKAIGHMRLLQPTVVHRTLEFFAATTALSNKSYNYHHIRSLGDTLNSTALQYKKWIRSSPYRLAAHEAKSELFYAWSRVPWNALSVLVMAYPGSEVAQACQNLEAILYEELDHTIAQLHLHNDNLILMHKVLDSIEAFMEDVRHHDIAYLELRGEGKSSFLLNKLALGRRGLVAFDRCVARQYSYITLERNARLTRMVNATGKAILLDWADFAPSEKITAAQIHDHYAEWQKIPKLQAMLRDVYFDVENDSVVLRVPNVKLQIELGSLSNISHLLSVIQAVSTFVYANMGGLSGSETTASVRIAHWEKMGKHFGKLQDNILYQELNGVLSQLTGLSLSKTMGGTPEPEEFPVDSPYQTVTEVLKLSSMTIEVKTYGPLATALKQMAQLLRAIAMHYAGGGGILIQYAVEKYTTILKIKEALDRRLAEKGLTATIAHLNQEVKQRVKHDQFVLIKDLFYKGCN